MLFRSVRANRLERTRALPGDDLIREPIGSFTDAVTIRRSRRDMWPWLVQMGAGRRAGWYNYDFIDNGHQKSADHIVPDLQTITREIAARTEQYWCPIRHATRVRGVHARYRQFVDYGDARGYHKRLPLLRQELKGRREGSSEL